jgi:hypothetical protein
MSGRECYHCKQWIDEGTPHDCWTTTETALTQDLSDDLREAWERLRETAAEFGEQRIYASHKSIMFSRRVCYFFVRPKKSALEVVFFLRRPLRAPQVRRTERPSRTKVAHVVHIRHRDEVEPPITEWLREAYEAGDAATPVRARSKLRSAKPPSAKVRSATPRTSKARTRKKA